MTTGDWRADGGQSAEPTDGAFSEADYVRGMTRLADAIEQLSFARTMEQVQRIVSVAAREATGCDGATFVLRDHDMCFYADEDAISSLWKGQRFPIQSCLSGWTMLHEQHAVIADISLDDRVPPEVYRTTFVKSLVSVPIRRRDPIGAIGTYWAEQRQPTKHEVALVRALADATSAAIESVQVHAVLEQTVAERPDLIAHALPPGIGSSSPDAPFAAAFANAPIGMAVVGLDGSFHHVNREFCRLTGYDEPDLMRLTFQDITHPEDLDIDLAEASRLLAGDIASYQMDKRYYSRDGHLIWVRLSVFLAYDDAGQPLSFISHIEDISARRRDEEMLRRQATLDALTGVYNRSRFEEELRRYAAQGSADSTFDRGAVFMVDLDGLKKINDQQGHLAGDTYLKTVADTISRRLRLSDVVARIGGDEFAVLMPHTTVAHARKLAQTLVEQVETLSPGGICIGIAMVTPGSVDSALERADEAMYRAKRQGGSHWCGPELHSDG